MLKLIIALGSNFLALWLSEYLISGFAVTDNTVGFIIVLLLFTVANSLILPMARFILKPLSILTFGLLGLVLNAILIYAIDFLSTGLTIDGIVPLLLATIIVGVVNGTIAYGAKALK